MGYWPFPSIVPTSPSLTFNPSPRDSGHDCRRLATVSCLPSFLFPASSITINCYQFSSSSYQCKCLLPSPFVMARKAFDRTWRPSCCSVAQLCVTLPPHGLKHARPPWSSPSPQICPSSCPLYQWCHPVFSSSAPSFSFGPQSFPASGTFHFRWPNYWNFSFSISPSSEYSGLISLKIDWLDLLAVQEKNWENVKGMAWTSLQDLVLGIYQKTRTGSFFFLFLCSLNVLLAIRLLDEWFDWKRSYFVSVLWSKPSKGFQSNFTTAVLIILKRSVRAKGICRHNWGPVSPTLPLLLVSLLLPQLQQYCFPGSSNILGHSCLKSPWTCSCFCSEIRFPGDMHGWIPHLL